MKSKNKVILPSFITGVLAILTAGSIIGNAIANKNSAAINSYFDILPYKIVDDEDGGKKNTEYLNLPLLRKTAIMMTLLYGIMICVLLSKS